MAEAKYKEKTVVTKEYILHLSEEEARVLVDLARVIGGSPDSSRMKHVIAIERALFGAGLEPTQVSSATDWRADDLNGSVVFRG